MSSGKDEVKVPLERMYLLYGVAAIKGRCPAFADGVAAVKSFTVLSPPMGLDYLGVYDGFFGCYSAKHLVERLHVALAKEIESELHAQGPRFLEEGADVEVWWRMIVREAFRVVDDELTRLITRLGSGMAVGCPAVVALVLEEYLGATRAVIYRGEEALQLTPQHCAEPCKRQEKQDVQTEGGHVVGSTSNLEDNMKTSQAISFRPYSPEPEVLLVKRDPRDKFLILATDGLWAHISPAEACTFIEKRLMSRPRETSLDDGGSRKLVAEELAEQAIRWGGTSKVTIAVILFKNFLDEHRAGTSNK